MIYVSDIYQVDLVPFTAEMAAIFMDSTIHKYGWWAAEPAGWLTPQVPKIRTARIQV
jgi:hypothetical protein